MPAFLLTPPAAEPLTLAEAKLFLRVEHDDDDDLIGTLVRGARGHVEAKTRRALITQTWRLVLDAWPGDGRIAPILGPLRDVVAARVFDAGNVAQPADAQAFVINSAAGVIAFTPWAVAAPGRSSAGIELDIEAGYGNAAADVPEPLRQAVRLLLAHWYEHRGVASTEGATPLPQGFDALIAGYRLVSL